MKFRLPEYQICMHYTLIDLIPPTAPNQIFKMVISNIGLTLNHVSSGFKPNHLMRWYFLVMAANAHRRQRITYWCLPWWSVQTVEQGIMLQLIPVGSLHFRMRKSDSMHGIWLLAKTSASSGRIHSGTSNRVMKGLSCESSKLWQMLNEGLVNPCDCQRWISAQHWQPLIAEMESSMYFWLLCQSNSCMMQDCVHSDTFELILAGQTCQTVCCQALAQADMKRVGSLEMLDGSDTEN